MTGTTGGDEQPRKAPDGSAWQAAQAAMRERNDKARETGKAENAEKERRRVAAELAERRRGIIYR